MVYSTVNVDDKNFMRTCCLLQQLKTMFGTDLESQVISFDCSNTKMVIMTHIYDYH